MCEKYRWMINTCKAYFLISIKDYYTNSTFLSSYWCSLFIETCIDYLQTYLSHIRPQCPTYQLNEQSERQLYAQATSVEHINNSTFFHKQVLFTSINILYLLAEVPIYTGYTNHEFVSIY